MKSELLEIESILQSYPRACLMMKHYAYAETALQSTIEYYYHQHIINKVESWLEIASPFETEIIQYRCFDRKTFDFMAIQLNYASHSSIHHSYQCVLKKIYKFEKSTIYH